MEPEHNQDDWDIFPVRRFMREVWPVLLKMDPPNRNFHHLDHEPDLKTDNPYVPLAKTK